jgi:hypothetical protein
LEKSLLYIDQSNNNNKWFQFIQNQTNTSKTFVNINNKDFLSLLKEARKE